MNPLLGATGETGFPDMRPSFLPFSVNRLVNLGNLGVVPEAFEYPLDGPQLEEIRTLLRGFSSSTSPPSSSTAQTSLPRVVIMTYAEAMGEGLLESLAHLLAADMHADCLTLHAHDLGGMLEGLARTLYGRGYFSRQADRSVQEQAEEELELAPQGLSGGGENRWLSSFLKRQSASKRPASSFTGSPQAVSLDAKIKESVNLYSVLTFLSQCMDRAAASKDTHRRARVIHLSGFGAALAGNPMHRSQILRFAQEANNSSNVSPCLVLVSECNPKADYSPSEDQQSTNQSSLTTMPLGLASFLLAKGRCERLAEIPNTPTYDANWLLDRSTSNASSFGGLRLFIVPPKDPAMRARLDAKLEGEHEARVRAFNARRIADVLEQLGIQGSEIVDASDNISSLDLGKSPLLLSEAIYLAYMASQSSSISTGTLTSQVDRQRPQVTQDSLRRALACYTETRALHRAHYTHSDPKQHVSTAHKLDVKSLSKYEKRLLPCIITPGTDP